MLKKFVFKKIAAVALASAIMPGAVLAAEFTIGQNNKTFVLNGERVEKLAVSAGDTVHFENQDPFFHNVFSLSDIKTFDLGSYPAGQSKAIVFDTPGLVEVECAIHPQMYMEIEVK